MARDCWEREFGPAETAEGERKRVEKIARMETETLYRYEAFRAPALIDDGRTFSSEPRTAAQMQWAEERLKALGFEARLDGRVRSFIIETETYIIYADPRGTKRIIFRMFKKPLRARRLLASGPDHEQFEVQDRWKNEVPKLFQRRVEEALQRLSRGAD